MSRKIAICIAAFLMCTMPVLADPPNTPNKTTESKTVAKPGDYWFGVWCATVPPAVRLQFNLPEKQGVLVMEVAPDSPAAQAGLAPQDILLRAGDQPLAGPADLLQAIAMANGAKLKIDLIRGGESKTMEVTPAKRPNDAARAVPLTPEQRDWETMQKWLQEQSQWPGAEIGGQPAARYRFFHPGAIIPGNVLIPASLPANMSVVIRKEGDHPATITVKRGDEKWEVTEKELDKLPADVRPHVERMLGRGPFGIVGNLSPDMMQGIARSGVPTLDDRLEKRLEEMDKRIDRIMRALEQSAKDRDDHGKVFYP